MANWTPTNTGNVSSKKKSVDSSDFNGLQLPVRKHAQRPEVTVFEEPGRKRSKLSTKNSQLQDKTGSNVGTSRSNNTDAENDLDFKNIAKEVREFGVSGLSKKDKKKYMQEKAQALGARKPKGQKIPYPILQRALKVRKEREAKQMEHEKSMGIFRKKKKQSKKSDIKGSVGRWVEKPVRLEKSSNNIKLKMSEIHSVSKFK